MASARQLDTGTNVSIAMLYIALLYLSLTAAIIVTFEFVDRLSGFQRVFTFRNNQVKIFSDFASAAPFQNELLSSSVVPG